MLTEIRSRETEHGRGGMIARDDQRISCTKITQQGALHENQQECGWGAHYYTLNGHNKEIAG